jgi:transposase InsO family protein
MIDDRDRIYGAVVVTRRLRAMGIRDKPIAPASPWQNGFAERLIGSIRRECLDHIIVLGEVRLRRILKSYAQYYNGTRTHLSLNKDAPISRSSTENRPPLPLQQAHQFQSVSVIWIRTPSGPRK